jgi:hypothetical protein
MVRDERDPRDVGGPRDSRDERRLIDPADTRDPRVVPVDARDERLPGDPRDERDPMNGTRWHRLETAPAVIAIGTFLGYAGGLWLQPARWVATPAYGELLVLAPQWVWGACYLVAALGLLAALVWPHRLLAVVGGHIVAGMLMAAWWVAFLVRWVTNESTTVVNPLNWLALLAVLTLSAALLIPRCR